MFYCVHLCLNGNTRNVSRETALRSQSLGFPYPPKTSSPYVRFALWYVPCNQSKRRALNPKLQWKNLQQLEFERM